MSEILVKIENLKKYFPVQKGIFSRVREWVKAVDDVSVEIKEGETLGLVGESGCGKSTIARAILRLIEPSAGNVYYRDRNILAMKGEELRKLRKEMQIIFQDPYSSLNPRLTVASIVGEALTIHKLVPRNKIRERVIELLREVGLSEDAYNRYPHEFSGGQRQRIGIARALAVEPSFIVCDEPLSALDVSIQAQILNLFMELREKRKLSYLFISHDLRIVKHISDRVAVMYLGKVVELANADTLYENPLHPYTRALLSSVPSFEPGLKRKKVILMGDVPSPVNPPAGCRFHPRCEYASEMCREKEPEFKEYESAHFVSCHNVNEI